MPRHVDDLAGRPKHWRAVLDREPFTARVRARRRARLGAPIDNQRRDGVAAIRYGGAIPGARTKRRAGAEVVVDDLTGAVFDRVTDIVDWQWRAHTRSKTHDTLHRRDITDYVEHQRCGRRGAIGQVAFVCVVGRVVV